MDDAALVVLIVFLHSKNQLADSFLQWLVGDLFKTSSARGLPFDDQVLEDVRFFSALVEGQPQTFPCP